MKKILASCLTCCALIGSMCFSSPMAQLHAMSTEGGTGSTTAKYDHEINLNLNEAPRRAHVIEKVTFGDTISVTGVDLTGYELVEDKPYELEKINGSNTELLVGNTNIPYKHIRYVDTTGKNSIQEYFIQLSSVYNKEDYNYKYTLDLSETKDYEAAADYTDKVKNLPEEERPTEKANPIQVKVISGNEIFPRKTSVEVHPGDTFKLNLPDYFIKNQKFSTKYLQLKSDTKHDYIIWDKFDKENKTLTSLTGKISDDAKPGETLSFHIDARIAYGPLAAGDSSATLVTYNTEDLGDGEGNEGGEDGGDISLGDGDEGGEELPPEDKTPTYTVPVEFKIVDDGKGDIIDDGEDEADVFLKLTPEYKKLTSKGETFKLDASVELDEDADPKVKEEFEARKKDGQFKVSFATRDLGVATVSEDGTVTAVDNGSTEILAYVEGYEDELFAVSKIDVEIPEEVEEVTEENTTYPKTGDNFMAISASILAIGLSALVAFASRKQKDVNEEK